jgi:hypothetical protein
MPTHFARFSAGTRSLGLILLRGATGISTAIDELFTGNPYEKLRRH